MKRFLKNLFGFTPPATPRGGLPAGRSRLGLEALDRRDLPASVSLNGFGQLIIRGEAGAVADRVTLQEDGTFIRVDWGAGSVNVSAAAVNQVAFYGGDGNDVFDNITSKRSFAEGGAGNDTLWGGFTGDMLFGGTGNDRVLGWEGDDLLMGDDGDDVVSGGDGRDTVYGDSYDTIGGTGHSGTGRDSLFGGTGGDYLHGGAGDDRLDAGYDGQRDTVTGGTGADTFVTHWAWVPIYLPGYPTVWYPQSEDENVLDFDSAAGDVMEYLEH